MPAGVVEYLVASGPVGVAFVVFGWFGWKAYKRESDKVDKYETLMIDKVLPLLTQATEVLKLHLEREREREVDREVAERRRSEGR